MRLASSSTLTVLGKILTDSTANNVYTIDAIGSGIVVNVIGGTVTTVNGRAMYTDTGTNVWNLENATVTATGTGYANYRGSYVLRGTTVTTGLVGGAAGIYDFRGGYTVAISPDAGVFKNGDNITLTGTPGHATGAVQQAAIAYTTDGSDPATSATATLYTAPFPVALGTVVTAAYVADGLRGLTSAVTYDQDNDQSPGDVASVQTIADLQVGIGTPITDLPLPTTASVTLVDGRTKTAAVAWDTSSIDPSQERSWSLNGALTLPANIGNPDALAAHLTVVYAQTDVHDFALLATAQPVAGGATSAKGATLGTLSAEGGDGTHYGYAFTDLDADNVYFAIVGDKLEAASDLPSGVFNPQIVVTSGAHSQTMFFDLQVADDPNAPAGGVPTLPPAGGSGGTGGTGGTGTSGATTSAAASSATSLDPSSELASTGSDLAVPIGVALILVLAGGLAFALPRLLPRLRRHR